MAFAIYSIKWRLSARRPIARGGAVFIAHCGTFPPSNPPETEKI